jgi:hypothetical protein
MTTLAALHIEGKGTWIAADQMLSGDGLRTGPVQKWTLGPNGYAVGVAGSARTLNVMQEEAGALLAGHPDLGTFTMRLRATLEDHGFVPGIPGGCGPQHWGQIFMVAWPNGLWVFDNSLYGLVIPSGVLWADGSGRDFALAAGHLTQNHPDPMHRVTLAVETASHFDESSGMGVWSKHLVATQPIKASAKVVSHPVPRRKAKTAPGPKRRVAR